MGLLLQQKRPHGHLIFALYTSPTQKKWLELNGWRKKEASGNSYFVEPLGTDEVIFLINKQVNLVLEELNLKVIMRPVTHPLTSSSVFLRGPQSYAGSQNSSLSHQTFENLCSKPYQKTCTTFNLHLNYRQHDSCQTIVTCYRTRREAHLFGLLLPSFGKEKDS